MPGPHHRTRAPKPPGQQPSPLFRAHNWLGRERIAFTYRKRRYTFRRLEAAALARHQLMHGQRSYTGWMVTIAALIVLLTAAWVVSLQPTLLLRAVDTVRNVVGPGPVASVESQVFRVGTFVRKLRVSMGDTAPRWSVEIAAAQPLPTVAPPTYVPAPTDTPISATPPSPMPTARRAIITVVRGGNLRQQPQFDQANVLGWVMPGDRLEILGSEQQGAERWLRVQLVALGKTENARPVLDGSIGWISALLLESVPATAVPATATLAPTAPLIFDPTPIPPTPLVSPTPLATVAPVVPLANAPQASSAWELAAIPAVIGDDQIPNEGQWQLLPAAADQGNPAMAVTTFRPDPTRPDIQVVIAAIDLSRAQLHMVAGTLEPQADAAASPNPPRDGRIPTSDYGRLLAAFNGGFKSLHGHDGMGVGNVIYRQPVEGRATIATYADGTVRIGLLNRDLTIDQAVAWRQNGLLLVDGGQATAKALEGGPGWGASLDKQVETWRSGLGVSADGRTLFFAVGDALTSARLAESLRTAGAWSALQLDINNYLVRFVTFQQNANAQPVAQALISAMPQERNKYLDAEERDFMYVTQR